MKNYVIASDIKFRREEIIGELKKNRLFLVKDIQVKIMATINNEEKVIVLLRSSFDGYYEYDICPGNYRIEINRETLPVGFKTVNDNILNIICQ